MTAIGFWLVALLLVLSSLATVFTKDLVRAVHWLALSLLATAVLYMLLDAGFLAGVQVLTYVGGVVTLMIFGVMVTRRHDGIDAVAQTEGADRGFIFASALFVVLALVTWKSAPHVPNPAPVASSADLARALLDEYLIGFEVLSLLLLAAIVGAVVLVRRRDPEPAGEASPAAAAISEVNP